MLSSFLKNQPNNSAIESQLNTESQEVHNDDELIEENGDDVISVATNDNLTHQQRYENRQQRAYSQHKKTKQ